MLAFPSMGQKHAYTTAVLFHSKEYTDFKTEIPWHFLPINNAKSNHFPKHVNLYIIYLKHLLYKHIYKHLLYKHIYKHPIMDVIYFHWNKYAFISKRPLPAINNKCNDIFTPKGKEFKHVKCNTKVKRIIKMEHKQDYT